MCGNAGSAKSRFGDAMLAHVRNGKLWQCRTRSGRV